MWPLDLMALFGASLIAATLLPAQSEALLAAMHRMGNHDAALLIIVATCGNVLGACINWWLGRYITRFQNRRWFPVKEAQLSAATRRFQRYGLWTLLLSWLPLIGDPLTVAAGILRTPFWPFLLLVTIGKLGRYIGIIAVF